MRSARLAARLPAGLAAGLAARLVARLAARWAPRLLVIGAAACGPRELALSATEGTARAGPMVLRAASTLRQDSARAGALVLRTEVGVRNVGADTLWLVHGACPVDVALTRWS